MPPATSRMFTTRVHQASRAILRPPGRRLQAVSPDTELKATAVQAEPEVDAVSPSLDSKTTDAELVAPAPEQTEAVPPPTAEVEQTAVSEASTEEPLAAPVAPAAQASEPQTSEEEPVAPAAAPAAAPEAVNEVRSEPPAPETPPEHVSVDDFPHAVGDVVTGRVLFSNARGARVAIHGVKGVLGYLPKNRGPFHLRSAKSANKYSDGMEQVIPQGTTRRFKILALPPDMAKGGKGPLLVCDDLDLALIWKRLKNIKDLNTSMRETIRCTVTGAVERGLLVNLFGVRGFIPVSHVTKQEGQEWLAKEDLQKFIGQEVEVSPMVLDQEKRTFTASMNNAVSDRALRQLRIGSLVWGTARRLTNYGVFMSLDDTFESALLHITNVSWNRVPTIESVFNEGDRVRAVVIGMDEGFSRISVSTRDLEETEGEMLTDPQKVYDNAERGVTRFLEHVKKWEADQAAEGGEGAAAAQE